MSNPTGRNQYSRGGAGKNAARGKIAILGKLRNKAKTAKVRAHMVSANNRMRTISTHPTARRAGTVNVSPIGVRGAVKKTPKQRTSVHGPTRQLRRGR